MTEEKAEQERGSGMARVVLIEDQHLLADALRATLPSRHEVRVLATAATLDEGLRAVRSKQPDLVIADYRLPDGDVAERLPAFLEAAPDTKVLVYTGWADESSLLSALGAGAAGFVEKSSSVEELVDAVRRVLAGEIVVAPRMIPWLTRRVVAPPSSQELSLRELQILELLAAGHSTEDLAAELYLASNTVRNNIGRILSKLGARTRLDAVRIAVARGLIRYDPRPQR